MSKPPIRNVPPPPGSKAGNAYTRFIPREELHAFEAWSPETLAGAGGAAAPEAPPAPPTEAEWQAQVAAARAAGYQDGYRDGLVALDSFKQSFAAQASGQIGQLVRSLGEQFDALEGRLAEAVSATAVEMARQIVRDELFVRPELVARVATEALGAVLLSARQITVLVNPQDLPLVSEGAAETLAARGARLVADPAVERGGCRAESDLGAVDARIGQRWAQAAAVMGSELPWTDPPEAE